MDIGEIEELEKIANEAINIPLERTSVEKLMYIMDVIMVNYDYNNTINFGILQSILFQSPERTKFLVKQLSKAIETKCNNDIDLESIEVTHDWGNHFF